jgi:hypothetical protein
MHDDKGQRTNIMVNPLQDETTVTIRRSPVGRDALVKGNTLLGTPTGSAPLLNNHTLLGAPTRSTSLLNSHTLLRGPTGSTSFPRRRAHSLLNSMSRRHVAYKEKTHVSSRKGSSMGRNHLHAHSEFSVRSCSVVHE